MTNETNQTNVQHLGGTYIKPGMLKRPVEVAISARSGGARTVEGKYGRVLEIPVDIEGQQFVGSLPADKGDGKTLQTVFGPIGEAWTGKRIRIEDSAVLNRVRYTPIG